MRFVLKFTALASFFIGVGLQVSGIVIPWLGISLMIFGGLLLIIPAWSWIRRIPIRFQWPLRAVNAQRGLPAVSSSSQKSYDQKYADWMTTALNQDSENLATYLYVQIMAINWKPLINDDSFFVIRVDIHSSSVFNLHIGTTDISGNIYHDGQPMERPTEILAPVTDLVRGGTGHLDLRQWVSQAKMGRLVLRAGQDIELNLSYVKFSVHATYPDGTGGPKCILPLPGIWKGRLPSEKELRS
ncbi:MAG: hypothetical protein HYX90_10975 [Chloroflexi bacterium]|nr:hypothetical protein [Chloroflexota bacterium]